VCITELFLICLLLYSSPLPLLHEAVTCHRQMSLTHAQW